MDWLHAHLVVNHFPIILAVVGSCAALLALGTGREGIWRYAGVSGLLAGMSAPLAYITGTRAEDPAEELWYVSHEALEHHEHWGLYALVALGLAGVLAIVALKSRARGARLTFAVCLWAATGVTAVTALHGGDLVHDSASLRDGKAGAPAGSRVGEDRD